MRAAPPACRRTGWPSRACWPSWHLGKLPGGVGEAPAMNDQAATISHAKDSLIDLAIRFGPRLFTAALILIVGIFVSGWVSRSVTQFLSHRDLEPPLRLLLARVAWALCFTVFALMA